MGHQPVEDTDEYFVEPQKYVVNNFIFSEHDDSTEFEVRRYDKCFYITMAGGDLANSPLIQQKYLTYLNAERLDATDDISLQSYDPEDFYSWALEPCLPLFETLAPASEQKVESTLYDRFHPLCFYYSLRVVDGKLTPVQQERQVGGMALPGLQLDPAVFSPNWPSHSWADVKVFPADSDEVFNLSNKVLIEENVYFFKQYQCNEQSLALRELSKYKKISESSLAQDVRICRIEGIVRDDEGRLVGLLLTYVDCGFVTLACAAQDPEITASTKQKWVDQVRETLSKLHEAGIVWGDAKPDNVLIDRNDDAWIIDFGGGYTRGYVDKELSETIEGDFQGLQKIIEYCFGSVEE